jgi:hypothetical protein
MLLFLQGRNIFDPLTLEGEDKFAGAGSAEHGAGICRQQVALHHVLCCDVMFHVALPVTALHALQLNLQLCITFRSRTAATNRYVMRQTMLLADCQPAGLTFLVIGTVAGAAALGSFVWVMWRWLALGRVPKPVAALRRLARAMRAATIDGAAAAPDTGVSKKYLLDIELELTGKPKGKSHAGSIEDAAAWSKVCTHSQSRAVDSVCGCGMAVVPCCLPTRAAQLVYID